jgi:hypothetical protein
MTNIVTPATYQVVMTNIFGHVVGARPCCIAHFLTTRTFLSHVARMLQCFQRTGPLGPSTNLEFL